MPLALIIAVHAALASAAPSIAAASPEGGLRTALHACESWLLEPSTWADGIDGFPTRAKISGMEPRTSVPDVALPPIRFRQNLHSWRVPVGEGGYFVTASDTIPICHIVGGGPQDFEPGVESVLNSYEFAVRWKAINQKKHGDAISSEFRSKIDPALGMLITRADQASARTDRGQLAATLTYQIKK